MSDMLNLAPQGAPTLPTSEPLLAQESPMTAADDLQPTLPFDELLAPVLPELASEAIEVSETLLPEGLMRTAPDLTPEEQALIAQQFMASLLVNPLADAVPETALNPLMLAENSAITAPAASGQPTAAEAATPHKLPVAAPATEAETKSAEAPAGKLATRVIAHKEAWHPVTPISHSVAHLPVVSMGQSQAQVNAPLRLDNSHQDIGQQLQSALGDRLNIQVNNQIQHATIRLDPPEMGKIEIVLHFEAGKLQVQINAGQSDVYRALQQVSNELRQALTEQHFVDVDVQVSSQNQQQQQPGHHPQQQGSLATPVLANDASDTRATGPREDTSILMTI
ncbi:MAG: flagellar hook-length control protein FliK [Leclercia sp.]